MNIREMEWCVDWIDLAQVRGHVDGASECGNKTFRKIEGNLLTPWSSLFIYLLS